MKIWSRPARISRGACALCASVFLLAAFGATATASAAATTAAIDATSYLNDIKFLASPELRGRITGSPELDKAAAFIAAKYRGFGLKPLEGRSYYQDFAVTTGAQ